MSIAKKRWFFILLAALAAGVTIGAIDAAEMGSAESAAVLDRISASLAVDALQKTSFFQALISALKTLALLLVFGTTVIGAVPTAIYIGVHGFSVGASVGTLVRFYGMRGFLAAAAGVLPHSLIYLPCFLVMAVLAMQFSSRLLKREHTQSGHFISYLFSMLLVSIPVFLGCLVEGYLSAPLLRYILR